MTSSKSDYILSETLVLIGLATIVGVAGGMAVVKYHNRKVSEKNRSDYTPIHLRGIEEKLDAIILEDGRRVRLYTQNNELKVEEIK